MGADGVMIILPARGRLTTSYAHQESVRRHLDPIMVYNNPRRPAHEPELTPASPRIRTLYVIIGR
jgi:hypothetical protein